MRTILTTLILLLGAAMTTHAQEPLRVATEGAYPPFNYIDSQGNLAGFDIDIARAICADLNRPCQLVRVVWKDIISGLVHGDYDMIVASMARTAEREDLIDFTDRYYRSRSNFVGKAGMFTNSSPDALKGKRLCAQKGTVQSDYLTTHYPNSTIIQAETTKAAFDKLVQGTVDAVLSDSLTIYDFLQTAKGRDFDFVGQALPADNVSSYSHIAVAEGNHKLRKAINAALKRIRAEGIYDRINKKYFPFSIY